MLHALALRRANRGFAPALFVLALTAHAASATLPDPMGLLERAGSAGSRRHDQALLGPAPGSPRLATNPAPDRAGSLAAKPVHGTDVLTSTPAWSFESDVANRELGGSARSAGDVNGDGFSDFVALGRSGSNGALYLFLGGASGPSLAPGFPLVPFTADASMINAAGDLNGDGFGDVVAGFPGATFGTIRVYYGNSGGLDTASPFVLFNNFANDFGRVVGPAGDVNGDGFDDLIVGSPGMPANISLCGSGPVFTGRVDVFYGSASGVSASSVWRLWGCQWVPSGGNLGAAASAAGDVNADGFDDIVIGSPGATIGGGSVGGEISVVYGSAAGLPLLPGFSDVGTLAGSTTIESPVAFASFGASAITAGDVNGDGYADVAVGAPSDDSFVNDGGSARVYAGGPSGLTATELWYELGPFAGVQFGGVVVPAGDVNGDALGDLLVSETARVHVVVSAQSTMLIVRSFNLGALLRGFGTAGDVDGDGLSDIVLGDPLYANGQSSEGNLSLYEGRGDGPTLFAGWSTQTFLANPNFGWSVASAGDLNRDGFDDLVVGAPTWDNFFNPGEFDNGLVLVFYGGTDGPSTFYDWDYWGAPGDQAGVAVASAGDVNGDGFDDLVVGAHQGGTGTGQVLIFHGGSGGLAETPAATLTGPEAGSLFGGAVSSGDFDGDGYSDVAVGAAWLDVNSGFPFFTTYTDAGGVYVYRGGSGGLSTSPAWSDVMHQTDARFGSSLAGSGDVDGLGCSSLIVGAPGYDVPAGPFFTVDTGRLQQYRGRPSGPLLQFQVAIDGPDANGGFGSSVAHAGDVNGDGFADAIVGAPFSSGTLGGQGRALVYAGGVAGLSTSPLWSQYGYEAFGSFGSAVSGAGDQDGDGLSDVLVGAVFEDAGGAQDRGTARVFRGPLAPGATPLWTGYGPSSFANKGHALANGGDVDGDGWSDLVFGEPGYTFDFYRQGLVEMHEGGYGIGRFALAVPLRTGGKVPVLGMTDPGSVVLYHLGRSAAGRTRLRAQWTATPANHFAWIPDITGLSASVLTGAPGAFGSYAAIGGAVGGLQPGVPYAWRIRTLSRSVYFPTTTWVSNARNGALEADLRSPGSLVSVEDPAAAAPGALRLSRPWPNPSRSTSWVRFSLASAGDVRLEVFDVAGRRVRRLVDGRREAGVHDVAWDGRTDEGGAAGAGLYFYRFESGGARDQQRIVLVR
jgi:hypothetical protein